jgi:cysteine synthase A
MIAAKRLLEEGLENVVTFFCDEGEKYLADYFMEETPASSASELDTRV